MTDPFLQVPCPSLKELPEVPQEDKTVLLTTAAVSVTVLVAYACGFYLCVL